MYALKPSYLKTGKPEREKLIASFSDNAVPDHSTIFPQKSGYLNFIGRKTTSLRCSFAAAGNS
jgi:hypothetical protein